MAITTAEQAPADNYLTALTELGKIIIAVSQPLITLYEQQALAIRPEVLIHFYCRCLEFILEHKITGNKEQLRSLIINTIEQNTEQGAQLHQIVAVSSDEENQTIDDFSREKGLIIVPVLKLSQFISDAIKLTVTNDRILTTHEKNQLEILLDIPMQQAFEIIFQATIQKNQMLQIANPLVFFLEHFSTIIGWLIGFFASLSNTPINKFLVENIACLKTENESAN